MAGFGETLWLTGNHPAIGGWAPSQASQVIYFLPCPRSIIFYPAIGGWAPSQASQVIYFLPCRRSFIFYPVAGNLFLPLLTTLWLTGDHPSLPPQLKTSASLFPVWTVVLELPLGADEFWRETPITYKYFLCAKAGGTVRWEDSIPERCTIYFLL